ncbi:hypothetical protein [Tissierella praeacuta]|jgi:hypothetical protein|uniref:hypothetical protein n=1 Tax=Tissierella praeacuta TaxID=43131 RepID=UPI0028A78234|nr:hypothetical protein [Tissierella praeacuta]
MNRNIVRSNSEFFFNLYQKFNKELLEEVLDEDLDELLLEKYYLGQKIDLYSQIKGTATGIFIESMLSRADVRHLDFILKLIDNIEDNAIIVFQAESFTDKIIERILNKIRKSGKAIDFYAIEISKALIESMDDLKEEHFLKVIDRLCSLEVSNPFNIVEKYVSIEGHRIIKKIEGKRISRIEKRNRLLIKAIREKLYYYPTIYREKRCLANRILTYSAGRSDVNYFISVEDRNGDSFVSVEFSGETENIYRGIKRKRKNFEKKIGYDVKFDDENLIIRTDISYKKFIYKTIDDIADVFERYVFFLSNYIFYYQTNAEDNMWNQHKQGTF